MKKKTAQWIPFFFLWGSFCPWAMGLNQAQKDRPSLQHEVTVTLKLIQVFVTDKDGKPVTDLEKTDFELWDNGEAKTITDFEMHTLGLPQTQGEEVKPSPAPAAPKLNRKFFFILDIEKNDVGGILKAKKAAVHFIETQLQPTDEVAVFSYSLMRGLVLYKYLSMDHQTLKKIIQGISEIPGRGAGGGIPVQTPEQEAGQHAPESLYGSLERLETLVERRKANAFTDIIKQLARYLGYLPGHKSVIFFSQGISRSLINDQKDFSVLNNFQDMSKELGAANSPVYTVNTGRARDYFNDSEERGDDSLKILSDLSGGKYFENVNHYQKIAQDIQMITGNYYVLGYNIDEQWDGKFHEVKVKVKREGYAVAPQSGYFNPKPFQKLTDFEKQFQLIALALSDGARFQEPQRFPLLALTVSPQPRNNVIFLSELQEKNLEEIVGLKTEITYFVVDSHMDIIDFKGGVVDFLSLSQKTVYHYSIASLEPGTYECRIVLRNLETGRTAMSSASVTVPKKTPSEFYLFSPLLVFPLEGKEAIYVKVSSVQEKKSDAVSLKDIYPFVSSIDAPIMEEYKAGTSKMSAIVRCLVQDITQPEIELSAELREQSLSDEIPLVFSLLSNQKGRDLEIRLVGLKFPPLKAGDYTLTFVAKEATTKSKSEVRCSLKVR
jgi:VWFA-related protein